MKIRSACDAAVHTRGQSTVILALTRKGYGMGDAGQGRMTTHQLAGLLKEAELSTDGLGRSDTWAALRSFCEVDRCPVALAALTALREQGRVEATNCAGAITRYAIDTERTASWDYRGSASSR